MSGMLRVLHTADVHLGARHADLGNQAAAQRERQFAAFRATVDLALAEQVDALLIAGDLFDSNTQPRRSVERTVAELKRLTDAAIRVVIIPGTHDVYDRASVYRAYDLAAMAGLPPDSDRPVGPTNPWTARARMPETTSGRSGGRRRVEVVGGGEVNGGAERGELALALGRGLVSQVGVPGSEMDVGRMKHAQHPRHCGASGKRCPGAGASRTPHVRPGSAGGRSWAGMLWFPPRNRCAPRWVPHQLVTRVARHQAFPASSAVR